MHNFFKGLITSVPIMVLCVQLHYFVVNVVFYSKKEINNMPVFFQKRIWRNDAHSTNRYSDRTGIDMICFGRVIIKEERNEQD